MGRTNFRKKPMSQGIGIICESCNHRTNPLYKLNDQYVCGTCYESLSGKKISKYTR